MVNREGEPFGQGTRPDPAPISERIASVHAALEVGQRRGLDGLVTSATAALGVLYGIAGRYGQLDQAHSLAAVPGDPAAHPATATAWQAWYLVASGEPEAARAIAGNSHSSSHGHCEVMTRAGRG